MNQPSFSLQVERTLTDIFDALTDSEVGDDLELDLSDAMLVVECENGIKLILNRQAAVEQIWLATPWEGSHFSFNPDNGQWENDKTGVSLTSSIEQALTKALGQSINL